MNLRAFLVIVSGLLLGLTAHAQIVFNVTGSIIGTTGGITGYAANDTITLSFVSESSTETVAAYGSGYAWIKQLTSDPAVFSDITFTGAEGAWSGSPSSPYDAIEAYALYVDSVYMGDGVNLTSDSADGSGLTVGGVVVNTIFVQGLVDTSLTFGTDPVSIGTYFGNYLGDHLYGSPGQGSISFVTLANGDQISFDVTGLSLSISAVPEPASSAALLGLTALGWISFRRRRHRAL